ncbi:uncharacterized protein LOC129773500 [Toxorhynchites rutilus septentrionalis]|uniref:uncharacterized protein LOC129773500 n=1 Tax=Toxorhynchites rutilus septentrionalis TaxID=329112 RepID=UPI00247A84E1|nr:uncharacterized protein LOC129773500 [Toxorhynchites rutilus septentrionalis]
MRLAIFVSLIVKLVAAQISYKQCANNELCVNVKICPTFKDHVKTNYRSWPQGVQKLLRSTLCNREDIGGETVISVCCPTVMNPRDCGEQSDQRISNGQVAKIFMFPWMALLKDEKGNFVCGGTLISPRYVLTAAHCHKSFQRIVSVRLGENDIRTPKDCQTIGKETECAPVHQDIAVEDFIKHPNHTERYKKNDIALIRLERAPVLHDSVRQICLPSGTPEQRMIKPPFLIVSGWGLTENGSSFDVLRYAKVPPMELDDCGTSLRQLEPLLRLDSSQICAGGVDRSDNCAGDSGGPLQHIFGPRAQYVQYGVVAFGQKGCGEDNKPGVYTNVVHYLNWIFENPVLLNALLRPVELQVAPIFVFYNQEQTNVLAGRTIIIRLMKKIKKLPRSMEGLRLFICVLCVNFAVGQLKLKQCGSEQKCVPFNDCAEYKQYVLVKTNLWPRLIQVEVGNNLCNYEKQGKIIIFSICCTQSGPQSGLAMLDTKSCGRTSGDRVSKGNDTALYTYPWMALLQADDGAFVCGGTLITKLYVLTAAHCSHRRSIESVRLGEHDLSKAQDCIEHVDGDDCAPDPQNIAVAKFIRHEKYSSSKRKHDIGLIRLATSAVINDNVQTICLPISNFRNNPEPERMIVTGWGNTEENNGSSDILQSVSLPIVSNGECRPTLMQLNDAISLDDDTQLCAGGVDRMDNCAGDSGGPLQYFSNTEARAVQHGIVSYGLSSCGVESLPGVYTKVSYYINWILQNIV